MIGAERKTAQRVVKETEAEWVDALRMQARSVGAAIWEKANLHVWLREMPEPRRRGEVAAPSSEVGPAGHPGPLAPRRVLRTPAALREPSPEGAAAVVPAQHGAHSAPSP